MRGIFAVRKGLEPSTSGVTGRHSNQLNYRTNSGHSLNAMQRYGFFLYLQVFLRKNCKKMWLGRPSYNIILCRKYDLCYICILNFEIPFLL